MLWWEYGTLYMSEGQRRFYSGALGVTDAAVPIFTRTDPEKEVAWRIPVQHTHTQLYIPSKRTHTHLQRNKLTCTLGLYKIVHSSVKVHFQRVFKQPLKIPNPHLHLLKQPSHAHHVSCTYLYFVYIYIHYTKLHSYLQRLIHRNKYWDGWSCDVKSFLSLWGGTTADKAPSVHLNTSIITAA